MRGSVMTVFLLPGLFASLSGVVILEHGFY